MAEREACGELVASIKAELNNDKKVDDKKVVDDESSCSEYEEIVEEYTATESEDEDQTTTSTTTKTIVNADEKQQPEIKKIVEEVKKTTITKKEEPKQTATKTVVVEKTTVIKKDTSAQSSVEEKKSEKNIEHNVDNDDETNASTDNNKGESLLIPLLQGLLHKNMPQARSSSGTSITAASTTTRIANQNSNNLKSSLKSNQSQLSSTSSNNNNSLGDSEVSSEVSKNSTLGQGGSNLRVTAQHIEDSGTESGEDLRLIAAGIRDSMQIDGIEDQSDMSLINEVTNALNRLESSLKEGKDLALDNGKRNTLLALVERLQTGLTAPDKLSTAGGEQDFPDETSSPEADNHRSNRQRFAKRRNRNNRHTVGVSKEELADARRYIEEMVMIENMSNCTTPESNVATTPPQFFEIQKQNSSGAILTNKSTQNPSSNLFRPNQFVPNTLKHSTEAGAAYPDVQLRQKNGNSGNPSQRQSAGNMDNLSKPETSINKRPLSDSYDSYSTQNNRVKFSDTTEQSESFVQEKNQYNRSHHSDNQPDVTNRMSPDITRSNRFNNKKQMMKRANTIDIPKTHSYNPEFDTDSEFEEKSTFKVKGLRGTVQVSVKRKPRQVVPNFEPKTENDHKFLAFIQKQNTAPGLAWKNSKSVSNWTNKFGNIKNVFESGVSASHPSGPKVPAQSESSAKSFWKKAEENKPQKVSSNVLTSALKAKERSQQMVPEVIVPQPIHLNNFIHNPQSAFRPIENPPEPVHQQFKPIPMERPAFTVSSYSPTKPYNSAPPRRQAMESPHYSQPSPTKTWVKQNTATNSPVTLPWTVKPPENSVLKLAATKFEERPPLNAVRRHQSFKQQEAQKRPSLPNTMQPCQYPYDGYSQPNYMSNSHPTSYSEYSIPRAVREDSLTNPQAEPLVLTPNRPAYSPHSLQPYEYYSQGLNANIQQSDMTDDDIDDLESMTEYRVEAKVMSKPVSQQAVTIGNRTAHMSDDEVFGKNSRAAKSLLSVMKTIGNGNGDTAPKKVNKKPVQPKNCISPNGRDYQAPIVEPLFPEVTKFEVDRTPKYVGDKPYQPQPIVEYQTNPAYVQPPQPPRRNHVPQDTRNTSHYYPQERPNVNPQPQREVPHNLPIQSGPISPASYTYSSPTKTPESAPYTPQIIPDVSYIQNLPSTDHSYSESTISDDYTLSRDSYQPSYASTIQEAHNQYNSTPKGYPGPQPNPVVNLPQIPLETSYTKVYEKPLDMSAYQQPPVAYQTPPNYQSTPYQQMYPPADVPRSQVQQTSISQQSSQHKPSPYSQQEQYYQSPQIKQNVQSSGGYPPQGTYQSPKIQQSPQSPGYPPQGSYQSPKVQQNPQSPVYPPQGAYQSPKVQQNPQSPGYPIQGAYQSPKIQQNPQSPGYPPQGAYQSPKIQQNPQSPGYPPQGAYQSQKTQQSPQSPGYTPQLLHQSPKIQSTPQSPGYLSQVSHQSPKIQQNTQSPAYPPQGVQQPSVQMQQSHQPPMIQQPQIETQPQNRAQQSSKSTTPLKSTYPSRTEIPAQQHQPPKAQAPSKPQRSVPKTEPSNQYYQPPKSQTSLQPKPQIPPKSETVVQSSKIQQHITASYQQQHSQNVVSSASPIKQPLTNKSTALSRQTSLDGQKRVQSQSKVYEQVDQIRRKSLGNILEITRIEREAQEQKAAAIKQDMYSVQQDVYSQQMKTERKTEIRQQQETKVYKSSAPDDTPDIVKSSLKQDDIPILKKFGPPQRHCYIPNAYQNPLTKSETVVLPKNLQPTPRKLSEPSVGRGPVIVETPSTPQPDSQDEIPRNIVFNNVNAFTSMNRRQGESSIEYSSQQNRPNKLSKCDSWHQICQIQNAAKPPSPKFNTGSSGLRRSKSGHTLALPKLYEAGYDKTEISEKQKTVAAYFSGQKSPNSLSRNSSHSNLAEESTTVSVKKSSINRVRTSEKASISKQSPSSGICRSHTMPQIANINLLDESNVEDAFEQLMNGS